MFNTRLFQKTMSGNGLFFLCMLFLTLLPLASIYSCGKKINNESEWVGTWATAQQLVEPHNMPPEPGLSNNTLRQVFRVTTGGERLRMGFSNAFSTSPLVLKKVHVALSQGKGAIDSETDTPLKFNGQDDVFIEPGCSVTSDPFDFRLMPGADIAVTIHYGSTPSDLTGHPGSRTTSYIKEGNMVDRTDFSGAVTTDHWYTIEKMDRMARESANAIVILGDSITDGRGSGTNMQNRWTDVLAKRLLDNPKTGNISVLNMGLGGNCVNNRCLGPPAMERFEHDVLKRDNVKWLIILEGINDIGGVKTQEMAENVEKELVEAYTKMIDMAHEKGIFVYGATLMPFGDSFYDTKWSESARDSVNEWIRNSGRFDAVIDLDRAMENPENPGRLLPAADTGDHLHPNETGHRMMAEAVDLELFEN